MHKFLNFVMVVTLLVSGFILYSMEHTTRGLQREMSNHERAIEAPMGGYKKSGIGREKGMASLHDYMQLKNVTMKLI